MFQVVFREWYEHNHDAEESQKVHKLLTQEAINEGGQLHQVVFILSEDRVEDAKN